MARKDLLKGLMGTPETKSGSLDRSTYTRGAIGAVTESIMKLRARAVEEIDPAVIDAGGLPDRLGAEDDGLEALKASLAEYGQQVPVLLRPSKKEGRYEVVYGRRRVAALRALGQPVRAMIRDLDDRDLIIAQGQENSARRDLTFIEKANFARQMRAMEFERKVICDALHIDKTVLSRMLSVADALPVSVIEAIGPAPNIGRDRWLTLAKAVPGVDEARLLDLAQGSSSDARFESLLSALMAKSPAKAKVKPEPLLTRDGTNLGQVKRSGRGTEVALSGAFAEWLSQRIDRLHELYRSEKDDEAGH